jgi:hypothetical protein
MARARREGEGVDTRGQEAAREKQEAAMHMFIPGRHSQLRITSRYPQDGCFINLRLTIKIHPTPAHDRSPHYGYQRPGAPVKDTKRKSPQRMLLIVLEY